MTLSSSVSRVLIVVCGQAAGVTSATARFGCQSRTGSQASTHRCVPAVTQPAGHVTTAAGSRGAHPLHMVAAFLLVESPARPVQRRHDQFVRQPALLSAGRTEELRIECWRCQEAQDAHTSSNHLGYLVLKNTGSLAQVLSQLSAVSQQPDDGCI